MPRHDLLVLTADDLAALSNRGNVKRAQRELEEDKVTVELAENDQGDVEARWSDGPVCRIPAGAAPADMQCTCPATTFCRHLVRTVLAYQRLADAADKPGAAQSPWDPGTISDGQLAGAYRAQALAKARARIDEGALVELVRSAKPTAHFDEEGCTVRFLVPGDLRYTHCDCEQPAPCRHVAMAVWAFRQLPEGREAGLVSTHARPLPVPRAVLDDVEAALGSFLDNGMAGTSNVRRDQLRRLEARCRAGGLIWIADILAELVQQRERYAEHNARFSPVRVAELVGELFVRCDAVRSNTDEVPQLLLRGSSHDRLTAMGRSRLIGLGCGAAVLRGAVELSAYLQDADTGTVVVVSRQFNDPAPEEKTQPKPFRQLAQTQVVRGMSFASLGAGQLLIQGGKRAANRRFLPGRARATVHPQNFAWDTLRAPVLAEDFQEIRARRSAAPPASLRARRLTEDFHICRIAGVESVRFDPVDQAVVAVVRDDPGNPAMIWHPYSTRGREGAEALLSILESRPRALRFVAGPVRLRARELVFQPTGLVFEQTSARSIVQPWIESAPPETAPSGFLASKGSRDVEPDLVGDYPRQLLEAVGELLVGGVRDSDAAAAARWRELARYGEAAGLSRLAGQVAALTDRLEAKLRATQWEAPLACDALSRVAALGKLAADLA